MKNINHIVIATTFREFNGSLNDEIQKQFLNSLANQSFSNFTLVVTVFREKNVNRVLRSMNINFKIIISSVPAEKKFSLSHVFLNGLNYALSKNSAGLIWTTCDVVFQEKFLETVSKYLKNNVMITSHPHVVKNQNMYYSINSGFDIIGYGKDILRNPKIHEAIIRYKFYDWGIFEHFLIALGKCVKCHSINLYLKSPVLKIENDREPGNETKNWLEQSWSFNKTTFDSFAKDNNISSLYLSLSYCHLKFKMLDYKISHLFYWRNDYLKYFKFRSKVFILRMFPPYIKSILRKMI